LPYEIGKRYNVKSDDDPPVVLGSNLDRAASEELLDQLRDQNRRWRIEVIPPPT
jgi:hypothetical protein